MYYNKKSNMPDGRKGVPMKLVIPEYKTLELDTIFLDMNGTIAVDGVIPPSVKERLIALSEQFRIYVLTADTHGNAKAQCEGLPVILETFPTGNAKEYKRELVKATGAKRCVAIGPGRGLWEIIEKCGSLCQIYAGWTGSSALSRSDYCRTPWIIFEEEYVRVCGRRKDASGYSDIEKG